MSSSVPTLASLGWSPFFESHRDRLAGRAPARVVAHHGELLSVATDGAVLDARIAGRLRHAASALELPSVGDWVGLRPGADPAVIDLVLPRAALLVRQAAGTRVVPQVIAANVDVVAVVMALAHDFNLRRLERYLAVIEASAATPLVVLTKSDLCADPPELAASARASAPGAEVLVLSAATGAGMADLAARLRPGLTLAFVGSSGAGKSTLVNALLGHEVQRTGAVRSGDGRGQHVTTHRQLFALPGGALVVDTPGMRELAAWAADGKAGAFCDIDALAERCRFADCAHESEPGCAVREAVADGSLDAGRLQGFRKLARELAFQARREDDHARRAEAARWKSITKSMRHFTKEGR